MSDAGPLIVWDIDRTLIDAGAAGRDIMNAAITRVIDREPEHEVWFGGKTDPRIAAEILTAAGVPLPHDDHVADVLVHLEQVLAERETVVAAEGAVLPGVREILTRLRAAGALQTVLTGNIQANAVVKLRAFGLDEFVDVTVGAFGSDHADRPRLLPLVLDRAARAYGRRWRPEETWVIGDTEFDFECAAASGARCLLVATGGSSYEHLSTLGADTVLPDLSDVPAVVRLLTS
ncbi:MAG: HAD hydrolase-like protein [Streptosporangiales bacterium]|nr:HAD hydrolase-like protein [Streptosporangiales bacterium]